MDIQFVKFSFKLTFSNCLDARNTCILEVLQKTLQQVCVPTLDRQKVEKYES